MSGEASSRWFEFARQDLRLAELAHAERIWNQACFHAQQCAEKALKGILADRGLTPPRMHKLADLLTLTGDVVSAGLMDALRALDRFYLPTRCPDILPGSAEKGMPGKEEADEAVETAAALLRALSA